MVDSAPGCSIGRPPLPPHASLCALFHTLSDMYPLFHSFFVLLSFFSFFLCLPFFSSLSHIGRRWFFTGLCAVFRVPPHFLQPFPTSRPSAVRPAVLPAERYAAFLTHFPKQTKNPNMKKNHIQNHLNNPLFSKRERPHPPTELPYLILLLLVFCYFVICFVLLLSISFFSILFCPFLISLPSFFLFPSFAR